MVRVFGKLLLHPRNLLRASTILRNTSHISQEMKNLLSIKVVDKIPEGKSQYISAMVYNHGDTLHAQRIVRNSTKSKIHLEIYDQLQKDCKEKGLCTQCFGAGYMEHDSEKKEINIYGKCGILGRADHCETRDILESVPSFSDYKITTDSCGMEE